MRNGDFFAAMSMSFHSSLSASPGLLSISLGFKAVLTFPSSVGTGSFKVFHVARNAWRGYQAFWPFCLVFFDDLQALVAFGYAVFSTVCHWC